MPDIKEAFVILLSYALGCFTLAYYLIYFRRGEDIRAYGSGNVGARNAGRVLGPRGFAIVLLGDAAKGAVALGLARYFELDEWGLALAIIAVVAGHIWPVQLQFRGGKGLATALGAMLVFDFKVIVIILIICGGLLLMRRGATLSALIAVALAPVVTLALNESLPTQVAVTILAAMHLFAHRSNIRSILKSQTKLPENHSRLSKRAKSEGEGK